MIFQETKFNGVFLINLSPIEDERGLFSRVWCAKEFEKFRLNTRFCQSNLSFNKKRGTFRGMHFQTFPKEESKIVFCIRGSLYDIVLDLRRHSPTYQKWISVELSASKRQLIYIPEGLAHGFQTLEDNCEVLYFMSEFFEPNYSSGIRWNDPRFGISLPIPISAISEKDASYPNFLETL